MTNGNNEILAFRFPIFSETCQSSRDLQMIHFCPSSGCARACRLWAGPSRLVAPLAGRAG